MNRLGAAMARPGMDTRIQSSYAYANAESFYDASHGVFVDVTLSPSGQQITARVPADYAGNGFGLYAKVHKDDELLVVIPNGESAEGAVVVARLWSAAATPPAEAGADADEVMLIVEKDKHLRLKTTGQGKIELDSDTQITLQCDTVRLGDRAATEQVVLGTTYRQQQKALDTSLKTQFDLISQAFAQIATASSGLLVPPAGAAVKAAALIGQGAATAAKSAVDAFENAAGSNESAYLSGVSNTK